MPNVIIKQDNTFLLRKFNPSDSVKKLPKGVYRITLTPEGDINLVRDLDAFKVPKKIYGDVLKNLDIVYNTWKEEGTLGVICSGLHGAGKTLMAELICNRLIRDDLPVIKIDSPFPSSIIEEVIRYAGNCVIHFDEFGKMYSGAGVVSDRLTDNRYRQDNFLNLFSNKEYDKTVFVVTCNDVNTELNSYLINRPGRFKFHFQYQHVDENLVENLLIDNKINDNLHQPILDYVRVNRASVDTLKQLLSIAKSKETLKELKQAIKIYNIVPFPTQRIQVSSAYVIPFKEELDRNKQAEVLSVYATIDEDGVIEARASKNHDPLYDKTFIFNLAEMQLTYVAAEQNVAFYRWKNDEILLTIEITDLPGGYQLAPGFGNRGQQGNDHFIAPWNKLNQQNNISGYVSGGQYGRHLQ